MMTVAPRLASLLCLSLCVAGADLAAAAERPPYVGRWDCGVGVFTFTTDTYDPGDGPLKTNEFKLHSSSLYRLWKAGQISRQIVGREPDPSPLRRS